MIITEKFNLSDDFIAGYASKPSPLGFNGFGDVVFKRTYARKVDETGRKEEWFETCRRVIEGTFRIQKQHAHDMSLPFDEAQAKLDAEKMYDLLFNLKFTPPGRGLWMMGTEYLEQRDVKASLFNCAFVSTDAISKGREATFPYTFMMDLSMLGCGVGFDTKGTNVFIYQPGVLPVGRNRRFQIPDTREGWVESLRLLLESYFIEGKTVIRFDYSRIRPYGEEIKGFGGTASGPEPLRQMHHAIRKVLSNSVGANITVRTITDIMNLIGCCVIAGNVRRTAQIAFGSHDDQVFSELKNYEINPERGSYGWASNNSIYAKLGMDYKAVAENVKYNGEPGFAWLENMQNYSRMNEEPDFKDMNVEGGNPCLEQSLEDGELCCLVETYPARHNSLREYRETLYYAFLYAKTVTLLKTHIPTTNAVMLRNRRIGTSVTGIAQFLAKYNVHTLREWLSLGYRDIQNYDKAISDRFAIPLSIKTTSVKPSGTVSLLAGATPGWHFPESKYYIRRMRLAKNSPLVEPLIKANYHVEPCAGQENDTVVASFPIALEEGVKTLDDVTMWEQLCVASLLQELWADNQVSATVTFDREKEGDQIAPALDYFQYKLKGVSFLPRLKDNGAYPQMPYEKIEKELYEDMIRDLSPLDLSEDNERIVELDLFCDGEKCVIAK